MHLTSVLRPMCFIYSSTPQAPKAPTYSFSYCLWFVAMVYKLRWSPTAHYLFICCKYDMFTFRDSLVINVAALNTCNWKSCPNQWDVQHNAVHVYLEARGFSVAYFQEMHTGLQPCF